MPIWGKSSGNESQPKYLSNNIDGSFRKIDSYAGPAGWYYLNPKLNVDGVGTISITQNTTAIVGVGTTFLTSAKVGNYIYSQFGVLIGKIKSIETNTGLTLVSNYTGTTISAKSYGIKISGEPELLVAVSGGLSTLIGGADIVAVRWKTKGAGTIGASAIFTIVVEFNEPVNITAGATLNIRNVTDSLDVVATFDKIDTTKTNAEFKFTAPVAGKVLGIQTQTITGTIADATGTNGSPTKTISASVAAALVQRTTA